jgi:hypothetical protein
VQNANAHEMPFFMCFARTLLKALVRSAGSWRARLAFVASVVAEPARGAIQKKMRRIIDMPKKRD